MKSPETSSIPTITFVGGGTTGETTAGFKDAAQAGLIPHIKDINVNAIVTTSDNGGASEFFRDADYRLHAPGDCRRTISALSANHVAASIFERRFGSSATVWDVADTGEELLAALYSQDSTIPLERGLDIVELSVMLSKDVTERANKPLTGLTIGHLVVAGLMRQHRLEGKGKNAQTALDEAAKFMVARGRVIADSLVPHHLEMRDGDKHVFGEDVIDHHVIQHPDDVSVWVSPVEPFTVVPANPAAIKAIENSDAIVVGPGSEYTSNIPPFLVNGMKEVIKAREQQQELVIIANLAKEETTAATMTGTRYISEIQKYAGRNATTIVLNRDSGILGEDALIFTQDDLRYIENQKVVDADLVAETSVAYDLNNPVKNRSKVKTKMATAAVAALAQNPHELLAA